MGKRFLVNNLNFRISQLSILSTRLLDDRAIPEKWNFRPYPYQYYSENDRTALVVVTVTDPKLRLSCERYFGHYCRVSGKVDGVESFNSIRDAVCKYDPSKSQDVDYKNILTDTDIRNMVLISQLPLLNRKIEFYRAILFPFNSIGVLITFFKCKSKRFFIKLRLGRKGLTRYQYQ